MVDLGSARPLRCALSAAGVNVVVNDVSVHDAQNTADEIVGRGGSAFAIAGDVAQPEAAQETVDAAVARFGALDLAFNNAGIRGPLGPLADIGVDDYLTAMDVNLHSVFYGMRCQIPAMLAAGGGAIVNSSSVLGLVGDANAVPYVTAKHGIVGMTKAAALGYASQGVRINSVHPGYIDTPLLGELPREAYDVVAALHPIGRLGTAEEVADLVLFLLSDKAAFVTGSQFVIDGAYTAL